MINNILPSVIILYGPPLAGKGTQADFLEKHLKDYVHLDFGTELRNYVKDGLNQTENKDMFDRAMRLDQKMNAGEGVDTVDLRFVVEEKVVNTLKSDKKLLVEGPGRKVEEAKWLANFFESQKIDVIIFHLHLNLDEAIKRSKTRWYIPNKVLPFLNYEDALKESPDGEKPYQRYEDLDPAINTRRYSDIYLNVFAKVLEIYLLSSSSKVFIVDASENIHDVSTIIAAYLKKYYGFKLIY
ncbi:MAG: nucleoside monophosphate kinase [candidate division SR1 bacterium]|nr:nucleoside monophosphate kinase [candidate division SR1 bacterium]